MVARLKETTQQPKVTIAVCYRHGGRLPPRRAAGSNAGFADECMDGRASLVRTGPLPFLPSQCLPALASPGRTAGGAVTAPRVSASWPRPRPEWGALLFACFYAGLRSNYGPESGRGWLCCAVNGAAAIATQLEPVSNPVRLLLLSPVLCIPLVAASPTAADRPQSAAVRRAVAELAGRVV